MSAQDNISERYRNGFRFTRNSSADFGGVLEFQSDNLGEILRTFERHADAILSLFYAARGLMVVKGLQALVDQPQALVELSRLFGAEVEDYHQTLTSARFFHDSVNEILILSNAEPCNHPPPPPPAPKRLLQDQQQSSERLPVQFPAQINWHTDQSYRRPPPDITLLLAVELPPHDQGQTLFADCTAALAALDPARQQALEMLQGIHAPSWVGRSRQAVENGEQPLELLAHQLPQRQPLVRRHPVTNEK
jgi:taurine dioxygenase